VALSAGVFRYEQEAALEAGMNDFIPKPFQVADLVAVIRRLVPLLASDSPIHEETLPLEGAVLGDDIDLAFGISQWKTKETFFAKLSRFADEHRSFVDDLAEQVGRGDVEKAAFALHKLKGSAGILAMAPLAAEADLLYRVVREGGDGLAALPAFREAMVRVLERIQTLTPVDS